MPLPSPLRADGVFEGGGVKGIAFVGALQAFEEAGWRWQNVAGTSAGAVASALIAAGYTAAELREIMETRVEFRRMMDAGTLGRVPLVGTWLNLLVHEGFYRGDYFLNLMRTLLSEKIGKERVTFSDFVMPKEDCDSEEAYLGKFKYRLHVVASNITRNELMILPQDVAKLGLDPDDFEVALAVRMSISIPYFFMPVRVPAKTDSGSKHWVVDGGLLSNFPIRHFDAPPAEPPAWPTFGVLLWEPTAGQPRHERIRSLISMTRAMVRTMNTAHDRKALEEADLARIVKIPTGRYSATDFDLTAADRQWLHDSGYRATKEFLGGWSWEQYLAERTQAGAPGPTGR
jgi:NTE family protein